MDNLETGKYFRSIREKFDTGEYGKLKHSGIRFWFYDIETISKAISKVECIIDELPADKRSEVYRSLYYRSFIDGLQRIVSCALFTDRLPSAADIAKIDQSYDDIMNCVKNTDNKENKNMKNIGGIKEEMQKNIDKCSDSCTIKLDEMYSQEEKNMKEKEDKKMNNAIDICNIVSVTSAAYVAVKAGKNKKLNGKYSAIDLAQTVIGGVIVGQSIALTAANFPETKTAKAVNAVKSFNKKLWSDIAKLIK